MTLYYNVQEKDEKRRMQYLKKNVYTEKKCMWSMNKKFRRTEIRNQYFMSFFFIIKCILSLQSPLAFALARV